MDPGYVLIVLILPCLTLCQVTGGKTRLDWFDCHQKGECPWYPDTKTPETKTDMQSTVHQGVKGKLPELKPWSEMVFHLPDRGSPLDIGFPDQPFIPDSKSTLPIEIPNVETIARDLDNMLPAKKKEDRVEKILPSATSLLNANAQLPLGLQPQLSLNTRTMLAPTGNINPLSMDQRSRGSPAHMQMIPNMHFRPPNEIHHGINRHIPMIGGRTNTGINVLSGVSERHKALFPMINQEQFKKVGIQPWLYPNINHIKNFHTFRQQQFPKVRLPYPDIFNIGVGQSNNIIKPNIGFGKFGNNPLGNIPSTGRFDEKYNIDKKYWQDRVGLQSSGLLNHGKSKFKKDFTTSFDTKTFLDTFWDKFSKQKRFAAKSFYNVKPKLLDSFKHNGKSVLKSQRRNRFLVDFLLNLYNFTNMYGYSTPSSTGRLRIGKDTPLKIDEKENNSDDKEKEKENSDDNSDDKEKEKENSDDESDSESKEDKSDEDSEESETGEKEKEKETDKESSKSKSKSESSSISSSESSEKKKDIKNDKYKVGKTTRRKSLKQINDNSGYDKKEMTTGKKYGNDKSKRSNKGKLGVAGKYSKVKNLLHDVHSRKSKVKRYTKMLTNMKKMLDATNFGKKSLPKTKKSYGIHRRRRRARRYQHKLLRKRLHGSKPLFHVV